jgi:tRNA pseudouridine55 synthase
MSWYVSRTEAARLQGLLNIDKPQGLMSRQVVDAVHRLLRQFGIRPQDMPKIGHAGTLDPLATGVLVVAVGAATRLIDVLHLQRKSYRGTFRLGRRSDTDDETGNVIAVPGDPVSRVTGDLLAEILGGFRGRVQQVPPAFSAVKVDGQRAYKLARRGKTVELRAKTVEIHRLEIVSFESPQLTLDIECSSGTYIRSLGRDLGERLGCGAVMSALVRTRVGPFELAQSMPLDRLTCDNLADNLLPCLAAVRHLPVYVCDGAEQEKLAHGASIPPRMTGWKTPHPSGGTQDATEAFALVDEENRLLAIGGWDHIKPELRPRVNLPAENLPSSVDDQDTG